MNQDILEPILRNKRAEVEAAKTAFKDAGHSRNPAGIPVPRRKLERKASLLLIAEIKRKSPSEGVIRTSFDPGQIARSFVEHNASAISVLTDSKYFGGSLDVLETVRGATELPILRKDFIIDPFQIFESKTAGADMVLLIARAIPNELAEFAQAALRLGLQVLIEVHNVSELDLVLKNVPPSGDVLIGVNNRDLATLKIDMNTCLDLAGRIPDQYLKVAESGISTTDDLEVLEQCGFDAVLIGTALATKPDILDHFGARR
jgi:indole-3-glycerol phosphate synthase